MHYFGNSLMIISDPSIYLLILISGAFTAAFVQGASGFGSGLVLNAFWLHIMEPAIAIPLNIITCVFCNSGLIAFIKLGIDIPPL